MIRAIFLALILGATASHAASFSASLDPRTTFVGEPVTLTLVFEGGNPTTAPEIPAPDGLTIQFAGQSQNRSFVNGRMTASVSLTYSVTPLREGDFVLPSLSANFGGQTFTTQPLPLKVAKQSATTASDDPIRKLAFLRVLTPRQEVYLGETFPVEIRLYVQSGEDLQMPQLKGDGFTFGKMTKPSQTKTQVGRQVYNLLTFRTTATAVKPGLLNLGPFEVSLVLRIPVNRRQRDPQDPFSSELFEGFFGGNMERRRVSLLSDEQKLNVLPLPTAGKPADFSGAVGRYTMDVSASPTSLAVGDPITLKIQIRGDGALDSLPLPPVNGPAWSDFKSYPPTSKVESSDDLGIQGAKTFEQVVIPEKPSLKWLPQVVFSFFDPEAKAYRSLTNPPVPLNLTASNQAQAQPTVLAAPTSSSTTERPRKDIVHIKPHAGNLATLATPWVERPGFWLMQTFPLLFWIGAMVWRKRADALAANPRLRRRIAVQKRIASGLAELRGQAERSDQAAFFASAFRLLQERLGERLDLPAASITESIVDERLVQGAAPAALCEELRRILQACDQARFAPASSPAELKSWLAKIETCLGKLDAWEPRRP